MDTNFILIPEKFRVDVFKEIEEKFPHTKLATVQQVITELKRMKKTLALEMIEKFGVRVVGGKGNADSALLNAAVQEKGAVCTNDIELKKRCIEKKIPVVFLRNKKTLEIKGGIGV